MLKYRMVASDFDDTMVDDTQIIDEATKKAVAAYIAKGGRFVLCTGRMISSILPYARELGLHGEVVGYQGTVIADIDSGKFLEEDSVPFETALKLIEFAEERGIYYQYYYKDTFVIEKESDVSREYAKYAIMPPLVTGINTKEYLIANRISPTKLLYIADAEAVRALIKEINARFGDEVLANTSKKFVVELVKKGIDKGVAMKKLGEKYGIPAEETICIGDSLNDLAMLKYAGLSVAVENASDEAKAAADVICPACNAGGVAWVLNNLTD